jgi:hypothetical protein
LVGERFSQEQKANLTLQEKARQNGGFPPDCWIPADLAHQWRTVLFPVKPAPEAVKQWTEAMRELGLAYRVAAEDTKAAEQLGMDIAADLSLLGSWVSEEVATKEAGSTATLANDPATKNPPIVLGNPGDNPVVRDQRKDPLTVPQYDVVKALLDAGEAGLTKDELDRKSKHGDARKILKRLADSHPDWEAVIHFPGTTGKRYRIG